MTLQLTPQNERAYRKRVYEYASQDRWHDVARMIGGSSGQAREALLDWTPADDADGPRGS